MHPFVRFSSQILLGTHKKVRGRMRTLRKISADAGLVEGSPARVCFISLLENTSLDLKGKKHRCLESTGKTSLLLGDGNRKTNKQTKNSTLKVSQENILGPDLQLRMGQIHGIGPLLILRDSEPS